MGQNCVIAIPPEKVVFWLSQPVTCCSVGLWKEAELFRIDSEGRTFAFLGFFNHHREQI